MKQLFFISWYLVIGTVCRTQSFDVNLFRGIKDTDPPLIKYEDSYYTFDFEPKEISVWTANLKRATHNIRIKKYDTAMNVVESVRVPGPDKDFGPIPPALRLINNNLWIFYYKLTGDDGVVLYAASVNPVTLETSAPTELFHIDESKNALYTYLRVAASYEADFPFMSPASASLSLVKLSKTFLIRQSPNGQYCFVAWTSAQNNRLYLCLLDKDLKKIHSRTPELPCRFGLSISSACVDNAGNAYLTYVNTKKRDDLFEVFISRKDGAEESKTIDLPGCTVASMSVVADKKADRVWFCGGYQEGNGNLAGVYHTEMDTKTGVWGTVQKSPFGRELVELFDDENWGSKKEKRYGLSREILWETNMFDDGVLHLTGEFRRIQEGVKSMFMVSGSILNASFRGDSAVFTRIPKVRVSAGSTYGDSYRMFGYQNELIVFYNDYPSNLQRDLAAAPQRSDVYTKSVLAAGIIRADGSLRREVVIDKSEEDYLSPVVNISELQPGRFFTSLRRIKKLGGITGDIQWATVTHK